MGSLIAFEVAREISALPTVRQPLALFVSSRRAPHMKDPENPADMLSIIKTDSVLLFSVLNSLIPRTLLQRCAQYMRMIIYVRWHVITLQWLIPSFLVT